MKKSPRRLYLPIAYVVLALVATILDTKISYIWFISVSTGTLLYPITFVLHDIIQKKLGRKTSLQVIYASWVSLLFMSLVFIWGGLLPADAHWFNQQAYIDILTPVFRLTIASIIAGVVSEVVDTKIFSYIFNKGYELWAAVISNFVGLITDWLLFVSLAFLGKFPLSVVLAIFLSDITIKLAMWFLWAPSILLVKRWDGVDV